MGLEGKRRHRWRSRVRAAAAIVAATAALGLSMAACGGGGSSSGDTAAARAYPVEVVTAEFPGAQRLGETSLMRIGVRNSGRRTVPALTVTITIAGRAGEASSLPFGVHDPEPGLAQPDRPVWVLAAHYPRLAGSTVSAGAESASHKAFDFGPLRPGATTEAVWKLSAVKAGRYVVRFEVGADLEGKAKAETATGVAPGGSFATRISRVPPNVTVTDSGEVVPIPQQQAGGAK